MCAHADAKQVTTEGGDALIQNGQAVWLCSLCATVLFKCAGCGIMDAEATHCRPCAVDGCRSYHRRNSPYCGSKCVEKAAAAKKVAGARKGWNK